MSEQETVVDEIPEPSALAETTEQTDSTESTEQTETPAVPVAGQETEAETPQLTTEDATETDEERWSKARQQLDQERANWRKEIEAERRRIEETERRLADRLSRIDADEIAKREAAAKAERQKESEELDALLAKAEAEDDPYEAKKLLAAHARKSRELTLRELRERDEQLAREREAIKASQAQTLAQQEEEAKWASIAADVGKSVDVVKSEGRKCYDELEAEGFKGDTLKGAYAERMRHRLAALKSATKTVTAAPTRASAPVGTRVTPGKTGARPVTKTFSDFGDEIMKGLTGL